ncbi:hypothetical protein FOXYSP1_16804 [Fusarium oxysporum f. sp. phaseoli]
MATTVISMILVCSMTSSSSVLWR